MSAKAHVRRHYSRAWLALTNIYSFKRSLDWADKERIPHQVASRSKILYNRWLTSMFSIEVSLVVQAMVAVAQLVESRIVIPVVAGSSPVGHPKN